MQTFNRMNSDGMDTRNYIPPPRKYNHGNIIRGAIASLVFILVCILCYLLSSVHQLQSQLGSNEDAPTQMENSDELSSKFEKINKDFQELKILFELQFPDITDEDIIDGRNELTTKFEKMKPKLDNLEKTLESTLINYGEHVNEANPGIHVDSVLNASIIRRLDDYDSELQEVQTLTQQSSKSLQNVPTNTYLNNTHSPRIAELLKMEGNIGKLKHLVTGTNYS